MSSQHAREVLVQGLAELGLQVAMDRVEALLRLAEMVESWGRRINLSGHRTVEGVIRRLALEAAALAAYVHGAAADRLVRAVGAAGLLAGDIANELPATAEELRGRIEGERAGAIGRVQLVLPMSGT